MDRFSEILFNEQTIAAKVEELAGRISRDYAGKELVLVCILKGAVTFMSDLMRRISAPVAIEFIQASSYGDAILSSDSVIIKRDIGTDIGNKHVLLVDTIVDTGKTLDCLFKILAEKNPASLNAVTLLDKKTRRAIKVPIVYCGFEIPDKFVVGYGMDYGEKYRNLPYIAVLNHE